MSAPRPFPYLGAPALLLVALLAWACSSSTTPAASATGSRSPSASPTETPTPVPPTPITQFSGPTIVPTPVATPGATIASGLARVRGRVTNVVTGKPVQGVCVIIGPGSCQSVQPHTDADGRYVVDLPIGSGGLTWDFTFDLGGYVNEYRLISTTRGGEQILDVKMRATADVEPPTGAKD